MLKRFNFIKLAKISVPIVIFILIYFEGKKEIQRIDPSNLLIQIQSLTPFQLVLMLAAGLGGVSTMMLYDVVLVKKLEMKIPMLPLLKISWISNTFNNVLGFGGFAGASLRGMLFKKVHK